MSVICITIVICTYLRIPSHQKCAVCFVAFLLTKELYYILQLLEMVKQIGHFMEKGARGEGMYVPMYVCTYYVHVYVVTQAGVHCLICTHDAQGQVRTYQAMRDNLCCS